MQSFEDNWGSENLKKVLKKNGVAVMPTDTIYGIVGRALAPETVNRIYDLKKRAPEKPCIILIGNITELEKFSIHLPLEQKKMLLKYWPGPVSIILDCPDEKFSYLHRGTKTLAFRLPAQDSLKALLAEVGPLIAPSANPEGLLPAEDIKEAKKYFGDSVDYYMDRGRITGKPSKLIKLQKDGTVDILRD
ncbi:threonylcarbamoyl-AMP synthase [Candidatus Nomurabacteria bacterium GWB1_40_6]|uniref:L-threonylcarbamoyladenylate synthase n=1 Tax=Candidatus Nomurabacteria bacterium GWB1_40_6 TaxID=1801727 RepID=A0A1F6TPS8_9BACT|nr:MAG: threonylcarbamoyl-AMP synthase [Candidatus Nomurabacteria bacterium GWB1_40_6]